MLTKNLLLATRFSRSAVEKLVLWDPKNFSSQGPALCHYMAEDARTGQISRVTASRKAFSAWQDDMREGRNHGDTSNQLTVADVAAYCYAQLKTGGNSALDKVLTKLKDNRHKVFIALVDHLLDERAPSLLTELLSLNTIRIEERVCVISRLLRLGNETDVNTVRSLLLNLSSTGLLSIPKAEVSSESGELQSDALELCEYLLHLGSSTNDLS
ncbi:hypothetical protein, partial [Klebsiella pneumoniae]